MLRTLATSTVALASPLGHWPYFGGLDYPSATHKSITPLPRISFVSPSLLQVFVMPTHQDGEAAGQ